MAGDAGDEFGDSIIAEIRKTLEWFGSRAARAVSFVAPRVFRSAGGLASRATTKTKDILKKMAHSVVNCSLDGCTVDPQAAITEDSPVISVVSARGSSTSFFERWMEYANIPIKKLFQSMPSQKFIVDYRKDGDRVASLLEQYGVRFNVDDVQSFMNACDPDDANPSFSVDERDTKKAQEILKKENIAFQLGSLVLGRTDYRLARSNLSAALSVIDKAILTDQPGISENRFLNLEALHEQASMKLPDFETQRNAFRTTLDASRDPEILNSHIREFKAKKQNDVFVYPRSLTELEQVKELLNSQKINFTVTANDSFDNVGFYEVDVDRSQLVANHSVCSQLDKIHDPAASRESIVSCAALDLAIRETALDNISSREISFNSQNVSNLIFRTVDWDREGSMLTDRLDVAQIPFQKQVLDGEVSVVFARENLPYVQNIVNALVSENIDGLNEHRFANFAEFNLEANEVRDSITQDLKSFSQDSLHRTVSNEKSAELLHEILKANGIGHIQEGCEFTIEQSDIAQSNITSDSLLETLDKIEHNGLKSIQEPIVHNVSQTKHSVPSIENSASRDLMRQKSQSMQEQLSYARDVANKIGDRSFHHDRIHTQGGRSA